MEKNDTHIHTFAQNNMGMNVPEGYFDTLHSDIMKDIEPMQESKVKRLVPRRVLAYAASVVLVIGSYFLVKNTSNTTRIEETEQDIAFENLTAEEFYNELEMGLYYQDDEVSIY